MPMVLAYHIIISAYGFWLPNDPRGSWSTWVRAWELFRYGGPATKVETHQSVAHKPHDRQHRIAMKNHLKYPPVIFNGPQAKSVAMGFARAVREGFYDILACAIMPDHAHVVVARDSMGRKSEDIRAHLKRGASRQLREDGLHPFADHPPINGSLHTPFAAKGWQVFLDSQNDITRAIKYVENNPIKDGLRPQRWSFVKPYVS